MINAERGYGISEGKFIAKWPKVVNQSAEGELHQVLFIVYGNGYNY